MTRQTKHSTQEKLKDSACMDTPDKNGSVVFLGQTMSRTEYEESCRNLADFFELLRAWRRGESDESSEL